MRESKKLTALVPALSRIFVAGWTLWVLVSTWFSGADAAPELVRPLAYGVVLLLLAPAPGKDRER